MTFFINGIVIFLRIESETLSRFLISAHKKYKSLLQLFIMYCRTFSCISRPLWEQYNVIMSILSVSLRSLIVNILSESSREDKSFSWIRQSFTSFDDDITTGFLWRIWLFIKLKRLSSSCSDEINLSKSSITSNS